MPTNLTDVDAFSVVTAPVGADVRNAASIQAALQTLANRTRYNFNRSEPGFGISADITALKAVTGMANGDVRRVAQVGIFVYVDPSATAEVLPTVVAPTTGTGKWFHENRLAINVANGIAGLDSSGRVAAPNVRNGIVDTAAAIQTGGGTLQSTASTSAVDMPSSGVTFTSKCNNGDVLEIDCVTYVNADSGKTGFYGVAIVDGATTIALAELSLSTTVVTPAKELYVASTRYVLTGVGTGGTCTVKMQFNTGGSGTIYVVSRYALRVRLLRP